MSGVTAGSGTATPEGAGGQWAALAALCLGFFMILVDSTIVAVANPAILRAFDTDIDSVVWVTSAYLLAYAVPLLVTGRLGDRFGPRRMYLGGLVVFTGASLWCGMSSTVEMLIVARVFQGFGAAMMSPQTMTVITRIFPPDRRGSAMGLWGAVAGIATLAGPLAGGVLVDTLGWEWIFFVNVPVGIVGFLLAVRYVPVLPTHAHRLDIPGVILSGLGLFCLVFGIQEANSYDWSARVWLLIGAGIALLVVFVRYQAVTRGEPLVPLVLFRDRNFCLANVGIASIGFAITSVMLPFMFYAQAVRGLSPTGAAVLMIPMAVLSGVLAPGVGRLVDRVHPRVIASAGFALLAVAFAWLSLVMTPDTSSLQLLLPIGLMGVASAAIWSPLSATATHHLSRALAGAGSGVYNTTRQVGAVLGSAALGSLMAARLSANGLGSGGASEMDALEMPVSLHEPFAAAMAQSMWLPTAVLLVGLVASLAFERPRSQRLRREAGAQTAAESAAL